MFDGLRRFLSRVGKPVTIALGLALWEIGARVGLIGVKINVLADLLDAKGNPLLWLYGMLTGGAFTRGTILALGIAPYFSARIFMRLARIVNPNLESLWQTRAGRAQVREWTRRLTLTLAAIQSIGFARFVQANGAAPLGFGFVLTTVLLLTSGSVLAMLVTEQLSKPSDADLDVREHEDEIFDEREPEALSAGPAAEIIRENAVREPVVRTRD